MGQAHSLVSIFVQQKSYYSPDNKYYEITQEQAEEKRNNIFFDIVNDVNGRDAKDGTIVVTVRMAFKFLKLGGDAERRAVWEKIISGYKSNAPLVLVIEVTRNSNDQAKHIGEEAVAYFRKRVKESGWTHVRVNPENFDLEKTLKAPASK